MLQDTKENKRPDKFHQIHACPYQIMVVHHLMGHQRQYLLLCYHNVSDLLTVRRDIVPLSLADGAKMGLVDVDVEMLNMNDPSIDVGMESWSAEVNAHRSSSMRRPAQPG